MNKECIRLTALCIAFIMLDIIIFTKSYQWYSGRQWRQEQYSQAVEQYETAIVVFDSNGLSTARSIFRKISGYMDSDSYVNRIDDELEKICAYDAAVKLCDEKKYKAAFDSFRLILDYRNVGTYVNQASAEIMSESKRLLLDEKYEEAISLLSVIPEYAGDYYEEAKELSLRATTGIEERDLKEKYTAAVLNYERENYKTAIASFMALKDFAESKDYLEKIGDLLYSKSYELYEQGCYGAAIQSLADISQAGTWSGYLRASQLREDVINCCIEKALKDAENKYYATHDLDDVIQILNGCENEIGKNSRISDAINDYKYNSVVYLSDLKEFSYGEDGQTVNKYLKSNYGETYKNSVTCSQGYVSYLIDGKGYSLFKGIIGCPEGMHSDGFTHGAYIEVIATKGDKQTTLYVSKEITDASKPTDIEIDISGYEVIYFKWHCVGCNIWSNWGQFATIFEGKFMK